MAFSRTRAALVLLCATLGVAGADRAAAQLPVSELLPHTPSVPRAADAPHLAIQPGVSLFPGLPASSATPSVEGLATAPALSPPPALTGTPWFGRPGPDRKGVASGRGGERQGMEGGDRLVGRGRPGRR